MSKHVAISPEEAADRLAIRELVEAYAHCADRRDAKGQMSLFTEDTHFVVYMNAKDPTPSMELHSREALAPVFADLNKYDATTHFVGQSTIFTLTGDRATGEAYCLAHHVTVDGGKRRLMLASLRYLDTFVKMDGAWLFAERRLYVDWLEERALLMTATQSVAPRNRGGDPRNRWTRPSPRTPAPRGRTRVGAREVDRLQLPSRDRHGLRPSPVARSSPGSLGP